MVPCNLILSLLLLGSTFIFIVCIMNEYILEMIQIEKKSLSFLTYSESATCFPYIQIKIYLGCGWAEEELSLVCVARKLCVGEHFIK